jgi:glycosyltransferase involved in cell wall biosynthesis
MSEILQHSILLIPAYNEEEAIGDVLKEVQSLCPGLTILVINDASSDHTSQEVRKHGVSVLDLPVNLGVAGAMQAGFRWAFENGYRYAIRCDSDGQHPAEGIPILAAHMEETDADVVIASRALSDEKFSYGLLRRIGIGYLCVFLSKICHHRVTDPTSGFQMVNRLLMYYFANAYPEDYPEPESLALLRRQGYTFSEVGVPFRNRSAGTSSLHGTKSLYFAFKVTLALIVDRARGVDERFARKNLEKILT